MIRKNRFISKELATYLRLLAYVKPYMRRVVCGFACGIVFALSNGVLLWVLKGGIKEVFRPEDASLAGAIFFALLFPAVGVVRGVTDFFSTYCIRWTGNRVIMDLRNILFGHLHELPVAYFSSKRTGELISRTTNDTMVIERAVSTVLADIAKQPVTLVCVAGWIFYLDARLALLSIFLLPLCVIPILAFGKRIRRYSKQAQERIADFVSILQETVSGARIVKAFGMEEYEKQRFSEQTLAFFKRVMRVAEANAAVEPFIVFVATLGIASVLIYVRVADMTVDEFITFAAALFMMYEPVKKIGKMHVYIQQSSAAADRIFEVLDTGNTVVSSHGAKDLNGPINTIVFDGVGFAYDDETVLRDISLSVKAGERIAFVGSSGAGKTTLLNLLPRFYDVGEGRICINGTDIRDITLKSLRGKIGLVTQETFLFNDTVANNISYGSLGADRATVEEAAERANIHDFISQLPDGYETVIGERGVRLSGGQRQRLAIARAIMRNPPILLLDEATSALDTESERLVQAAIDKLMEGRTVFAIAHRLSTIANCNRILVLDSGRIVESGTHDELLQVGGAYRKLYDLQNHGGREH